MRHLLSLALLFSPVPAMAQNAAIMPAATGNAVLRVGTEVPLRLSEDLTTKGKVLRMGQRFHMEVAEAVLVQGVVVIPAGSPAMGEITDVRNKGMWGKSGHLAGRVLYIMVNGRQIRMTGAFDDKGTAGGVGAVATSAIIFAPAGFFMTGTSAHMPTGAPIKAFVDEDVALTMPGAQQAAPLVVAAPIVTPVAAPPAVTTPAFTAPAFTAPAFTAPAVTTRVMPVSATNDSPLPAARY